MILFYGMGGGFGHLTRIRAFIHTYQIEEPYQVLTTNRSAHTFITDNQLLLIDAEKQTTKKELAEKIKQATSHLQFDHLYIDTFPCGILGEFVPGLIKTKRVHYLARHMIWANYKNQLKVDIQFDKIYRFEPLQPEHEQFTQSHSKEVIEASLSYPQSNDSLHHISFDFSKPLWLITHTTHSEELRILVDHAQDIANIEKTHPQLIILSDQEIPLPNAAILLHGQNPVDWYAKADKIFSAAGFNTWYQLKPWREKHVVIPFKRKFDDQFWRVSEST